MFGLPVLYYSVTHNITNLGVETLNTTALSITLNGTIQPDSTYLVSVFAVNAAGKGLVTSGICSLPVIGECALKYLTIQVSINSFN